MTHDDLLARIRDSTKAYADYIGGSYKPFNALRAAVEATEYPPTSDSWQWADGWKCAMITIFNVIEKELQ